MLQILYKESEGNASKDEQKDDIVLEEGKTFRPCCQKTSVSARVRFLRFWRNKLTADALTVCLCVFCDAHKKQQWERNSIFFMCRDLRTSIYLDDNASINSVPVENRPAQKYLCWVFPLRIWFISKTTTAHVKSHLRFAQMRFRSKGCKTKRPLVKTPPSQNVPELVKTSPNTKKRLVKTSP